MQQRITRADDRDRRRKVRGGRRIPRRCVFSAFRNYEAHQLARENDGSRPCRQGEVPVSGGTGFVLAERKVTDIQRWTGRVPCTRQDHRNRYQCDREEWQAGSFTCRLLHALAQGTQAFRSPVARTGVIDARWPGRPDLIFRCRSNTSWRVETTPERRLASLANTGLACRDLMLTTSR